ncbi:hypothetical protein COEREDRAFT_81123 [Coemansia reversa NRRL 1564]|uniref:RRM domain-containing protein n=1 Tax=Coemansia reversa (strain ATCC 12441 / NRRL 1564) TaxID=763665 RepID=A0A2G5BBQ4_COERN|nr:hypothetical protein COEREDRAFT_81123 [Coemansia reversa NRRL 1564]|eukprot:PIA16443.1 hypothetical protein COEREDRAFT_81123 [Coemansia reversa NRRL 1564]
MSRLYVGRLPRDVRERDVERLFKGYGQIRDICLLSGFGFVEFRDRHDAEDVMHDFNNRTFMGERLIIEPARLDRRRERGGPDRGGPDRGGPDRGGFDRRDDRRRMGGASGAPQRTPFRVLVENLSSMVSWQDLKDFARRAGEVSFADAHKLRPGEGIVEFVDESGLRNALRKLDGEELRGRRIVIRKDPGPRGGGGGGGPRGDHSFRERSYSPAGGRSPGYRRSPYYRRSRSPGRRMSGSPGRRMSGSPGRRMSRSPSPRSRSPRDRDDLPPPPPPGHRSSHSPMSPRSAYSPRSAMSPRSPSSHELNGEPNPVPPPAEDEMGSGWA